MIAKTFAAVMLMTACFMMAPTANADDQAKALPAAAAPKDAAPAPSGGADAAAVAPAAGAPAAAAQAAADADDDEDEKPGAAAAQDTETGGAGSTETGAGDGAYWTKKLPLHPKVVHIPIALCIVMPLVVLACLFGVARGWFSPSVWALAVMLQAIQLGGAVVALKTGEADEKIIEGYASDEAIHRHEEAAELFTFATGGTLAVLAVTWALRNRKGAATGLAALSLVATIGVAYAGYRVGDAGGRLVYISGAADAHK